MIPILINVGIIVGYYVPAYKAGGPIRTVEAMASTHSSTHRFSILTSNSDLGEPGSLSVETNQWISRPEASVYYFDEGKRRSYWRGLMQLRHADLDYLCVNGIFSVKLSLAPVLLARLHFFRRSKLIIAPRGELGAGALQTGALKKMLYIRAFRLLGLHKKATWHASSPNEMREIQAQFPSADVVVRINETLLPAEADRNAYHPDAGSGTLRLVYIGRLAPKKGLDRLFAALHQVVSKVDLDIYGRDVGDNYMDELSLQTESLPPNITVRFLGDLPNNQVVPTFSRYDYFAFPTLHENFGHVIAESLAGGCPVLVGPVTAFTDVVAGGGGVLLEDSEASTWSTLIDKLAQLTPEQKAEDHDSAASAYSAWRGAQVGPSVFEKIQHSRR